VTPGVLAECRSTGIDSRKLFLLPNGIALPTYSRKTRATAAGVKRLVTVARLEPPKRHDLLLDAVANLSRERHVELTVIGSGADGDRLRERARKLAIDDFVTFTGFVADPSPYIATADAFVLSTDHEGFGNVLVEALACGVPLVVSDVPYGPRFIVDGSPLATLVEPGSAEALTRGLRAVLEHPPTPEERLQARRRAEDFALDRVAQRFEAIIGDILSGQPGIGSFDAWP
jgi:glycosyltransferase involved in cell wall biosynthesis